MRETCAIPDSPQVTPGPSIEQAKWGTGSYEILERVLDPLRRALADRPASGSVLARRLRLRKCDVLAGLRVLVAASEVRRLGRDGSARFVLRAPRP
jgi:hypothetical protein